MFLSNNATTVSNLRQAACPEQSHAITTAAVSGRPKRTTEAQRDLFLNGRETTTGQKRCAFGTILQLNRIDVKEQILLGGRLPAGQKRSALCASVVELFSEKTIMKISCDCLAACLATSIIGVIRGLSDACRHLFGDSPDSRLAPLNCSWKDRVRSFRRGRHGRTIDCQPTA